LFSSNIKETSVEQEERATIMSAEKEAEVSSEEDSLFDLATPEEQERLNKLRKLEAERKQVTLGELTKLGVAQESFSYVRLINTHMDITFEFTIEPINKWQHDCDCSFIYLQLMTKPGGEKWIQYDDNHHLRILDGVSLLPNNECTGPVSDVYRTVCVCVIRNVSFTFLRIPLFSR
jgi:hypothetical protein